MSGDVTYQALERLSHMPDSDNPATAIAGQKYYDVEFTGGRITGITPSGFPTPLAISDGGTGQIIANSALNALLPSQTGQSGKALKTDGTNTSWSLDTDTGITQLTGDVTAGPGSGSQAAIVAKIGSVTVTGATGTGKVVFDTSPTLSAPTISGGNIDNASIGTITQGVGNFTAASALRFTVNGATVPSNGIYLPATNKVGIAANSALSFQVTYETGTGTPINYLTAVSTGTTFFPYIEATGGDTNISLIHVTKGSGGHFFNTNGPRQAFADLTQFGVLHTAGATRYVTATGSNGGNPSLSTSAGDIVLTSTTGNVDIGTAAIATTATGGFLWIPSCAGPPTGVATAPFTNAAGLVYDSTNNFLYIRCGGTWRKSTVYA